MEIERSENNNNNNENNSNKLKIELIKVFLSHIMNMREQIPLPFQLLLQKQKQNKEEEKQEEERSNKLKIKRYESKLNLILLQYEKLINDISNLCFHFNVLKVGIFLGPSPTFPKEGYILYFNDFIEEYVNQIEITIQKINQIGKKVIRKFIEFWSENNLKRLPMLNTYVALCVSESNMTHSSSYFENYSHDSLFTIREHFNPQICRKSSSLTYINLQGKDINITKDNIETNDTQQNTTEIWFVQSKGIKGIKGVD